MNRNIKFWLLYIYKVLELFTNFFFIIGLWSLELLFVYTYQWAILLGFEGLEVIIRYFWPVLNTIQDRLRVKYTLVPSVTCFLEDEGNFTKKIYLLDNSLRVLISRSGGVFRSLSLVDFPHIFFFCPILNLYQRRDQRHYPPLPNQTIGENVTKSFPQPFE